MDASRFSSTVVSIISPGPLSNEIKAAGINVESLDCSQIGHVPLAVWRLAKIIRRVKPDIVQTWLYHADMIGTLASFVRPQCRLVWNIRCSDLTDEKRLSWRVLRFCLAQISRAPNCIIANSVAGIKAHTDAGYRPRRWVHIPNGWSLASHASRAAGARDELRRSFGLPAADMLIGFPAHLRKQKDFESFFAAVELLQDHCPNLKFVLIGANVSEEQGEISRFLQNGRIRDRLIFLGEQAGLERLLPALDAVTLTSAYGEGMPNVIGEAMAAGLPVVATNVGDVGRLVLEQNSVVPPRVPQALADKWIALANLNPMARAAIGERNRARIEARYSIESMVGQYESLYTALVTPQSAIDWELTYPAHAQGS